MHHLVLNDPNLVGSFGVQSCKFQLAQSPNLKIVDLSLPVVVASAEVDVVEGGVDRKVRRLLDDQGPLGEGEAEAGQRSVPA